LVLHGVDKEDFMRNVRLIDFLKLKGSVGTPGNQAALIVERLSITLFIKRNKANAV
jgi:hypothetical protein